VSAIAISTFTAKQFLTASTSQPPQGGRPDQTSSYFPFTKRATSRAICCSCFLDSASSALTSCRSRTIRSFVAPSPLLPAMSPPLMVKLRHQRRYVAHSKRRLGSLSPHESQRSENDRGRYAALESAEAGAQSLPDRGRDYPTDDVGAGAFKLSAWRRAKSSGNKTDAVQTWPSPLYRSSSEHLLLSP
jgi:hypothetical protein